MTNLGGDCLILGYPWFQKFNPNFNWATNMLKGEDVEIDTAGYHFKLQPQLQVATLTEDEIEREKAEVQKLIPEPYHHHWEVCSQNTPHNVFSPLVKRTTPLI